MSKYIDREELIRDIISDMALFMGTLDDVQKHDEQCNRAISYIKSATGADVVPVVHGRWVPFHSEAAGDIQYCSACEIGFDAKTDYCPHCGAKMDIIKRTEVKTMRLIDAESAMSTPVLPKEYRNYQTGNLDDAYERGWEDALENLKNAPTVDAAPVVRCKDCKYRDGTPGQPNILCAQMHEDDFCSYGKCREGKDG